MANVIGACGLVCSNCGAYKATQANDAEAIARIAGEWSKEYGGNIQPESVWCDGCLTAGTRKCGHTGECEIRACAIARGVANCAECPDYACDKIMQFIAGVPEARETLESLRNA